MKCPHCLVGFHEKVEWVDLGEDIEGGWGIEKYLCSECKKLIFYLVNGIPLYVVGGVQNFTDIKKHILFRPKGSNRSPVPSQVPQKFAEDYIEACVTITDSPKASAALSRRCLQNLLREVGKVKPGRLADEIQQVIDGNTFPSYLVEVLHNVRIIGNFAAHPIKSEKTGEIIPVEPHEAEWNLDTIEALFDFYFVQPEIIRKKKQALDKKLE